MDLLGAKTDEEVLGKRPGDLLKCIHAHECLYGCGTSEFCSQCGAVNAVLKSQQERIAVEKECRIISTGGSAYDFRVWASPYHYEGKDYTVVSLVDIRHEKRRHALERMFFHDVNNLLSALVMSSELINSLNVPGDAAQSIAVVKMISNKLAAEIVGYRKLLQAEDRQLMLELEPDVKSLELVDELVCMFTPMRSKKPVVQADMCEDFVMNTDRLLLHRVLHNMVKNAVEASSPQDVISIRCTQDGSSGLFSVHNPGCMPRSTQLLGFPAIVFYERKRARNWHVQHEAFRRGILKGKVWFSTSEKKGTTFFVSVPLSY